MDGLLLAYDWSSLKSDPVRRAFERELLSNIKVALRERGIPYRTYPKRGRVFVKTKKASEACELLRRVFGLVWLAPCHHLPTCELRQIREFCENRHSEWIGQGQSFAVRVRRTGKHDYTSRQLARAVTAVIDRQVDLAAPYIELFVEVHDKDTYIYTERVAGAGGLPLGTAGRVVCLISGGIDSPVAAWMMARRGCELVPLFAWFPLGGDESDLARYLAVVGVLRKWHLGRRMECYIFRHGPSLVKFRQAAPKYTCILCRRMMYRVAAGLARRVDAKAIVTGENLAQVASQTLVNLRATDQAAELPVLRPVLGADKVEVVRLAKRIGSYESSCMPARSGCAPKRGCWARPTKPSTRAQLEKILEIERTIDIDGLLERSLKSLRQIDELL